MALRLMCAEPAEQGATSLGPGKTQRYGVFLDFGSLFQHPNPGSGVMRTPEEDELFAAGLGAMGNFYSDASTLVLRLTTLPKKYPEGYELPEGSNVAEYPERGWCYTESRWASLTKGHSNTLDLGCMSGAESSRAELVAACTKGGGRAAPLLPEEFASILEQKNFTNGKADRPLVHQDHDLHGFSATFT